MTERKSLAIISVITVIACLFVLFAGLSSYSVCRSSVVDEKEDLDELTERCSKLDDALTLLDTDANEYAALKADYASASAEYEAAVSAHEASVKAYESGVVSFNQGLMTQSIGGMSLEDGKAQLESGWDAYNQGLAAYNEGKAQFEAGKAQYDQLMDGIAQLEATGLPHTLALAAVSVKAGMLISDQSISEMKAGIDEGQAQLDSAKAQLDSAYAQLSEAQSQVEQMAAMSPQASADIPTDREGLNAAASKIGEDQKALDEKKAALDAQKEELKKYENAEETISRSVSKLVDTGTADADSTPDEALELARAAQKKAARSYNAKIAAFIVGFVLLICDIVLAVFTVIEISRENDRRATNFAIAVTVISGIVCIAAILRFLWALILSLLILLACSVMTIVSIKREPAEQQE